MDQNREEVVLVGYQNWLEDVLLIGKKTEERILLIIALINSSSVEDPTESLTRIKNEWSQTWKKSHFFNENNYNNTLKNLLSKEISSELVFIYKKTVAPKTFPEKESIKKFISDLSKEDKSYIIKKKQDILIPLLFSSIDELALTQKKSISEKIYDNCRFWVVNKSVNWLYVIIFSLITLLLFYIVYLGWAEKPSINIELNVGEIIGGILAGAGVFLAGKAYAQKKIQRQDD